MEELEDKGEKILSKIKQRPCFSAERWKIENYKRKIEEKGWVKIISEII